MMLKLKLGNFNLIIYKNLELYNQPRRACFRAWNANCFTCRFQRVLSTVYLLFAQICPQIIICLVFQMSDWINWAYGRVMIAVGLI